MVDILIAIAFPLTWFIILHLQGVVIRQGRRIAELEQQVKLPTLRIYRDGQLVSTSQQPVRVNFSELENRMARWENDDVE